MNKRNIITGVAGLLLAGAAVAGLAGWQAEKRRAEGLESQLADLQQQEKRSAVVRSVSKQMEEIAYQQKEISDEQRVEAQQQTLVANEERQKAQASEQQARASEQRALESERQAQDARLLAENERQVADHQRSQAELSRSIADTLRYRALGRSLGSLSMTQAQSGNKDIADLLAYAAYVYTNRYKGDLFNSAVLQPLMTASQSKQSWAVHNGAVTCIDFVQGSDDELVSVSNYGEIIHHKKTGNQLKSTVLLKDNQYDFRYAYMTGKGAIRAISRSGHLILLENGHAKRVFQIAGVEHPNWMSQVNSDLFIVSGDKSIAFLNQNNYQQTGTHTFNANITAYGRKNNHPVLFDDKGYLHEVVSASDIQTKTVPVKGTVTAFAESKNAGIEAYGMSDGSIYVIDRQGNVRKLVGHRSRISRLKLNGKRLFSSSYDGTLNLWMITNDKNEKIDPMPLFSAGTWIIYFTNDESKKYLWTGDQKGILTEALIDIPTIVAKVKGQLKRDLTTEEWNYYIGQTVPRESFLSEKSKE